MAVVRAEQEARGTREVRGTQAVRERRKPSGPAGPGQPTGVAFRTAARMLGLMPREFELAEQLGEVRTISTPAGRRVAREELARLTGAEGFPEALRARLRVVGTAEGAELLGISPGRLTRLARGGFFAPARFYVNRYRRVVWLYLATELEEFAAREPDLLTGRTPPGLSASLAAGEDARAERWRKRRIDQLLSRTRDPWKRAGVLSTVLDPDELARAVTDPHDRDHVRDLRPALVPVRPAAAAARKVIDRVQTAEGPQEILRYRVALADAVREARRVRPAPRPDAAVAPLPTCRTRPPGRSARRPRGLWRRLVGKR
ncbi:DUF6397 family protein [Streptomyces sp. NPDC007983]|uniref:DUF6397 family protein n=1 Tax=Streptomyces sp. NPDC007983 TaxID=3364800 RepID=UPI0036EE1E70